MTESKIDVWKSEPGGLWACSIDDGRPTYARRRDDAIFWAGWWHGRRQLGADITRLVDGGARMEIRDRHAEPAPDSTPCPECEAIGEHESTCRESPNWEPSDDDLDLNGERNGAEAERRALRDAGRDGGVW